MSFIGYRCYLVNRKILLWKFTGNIKVLLLVTSSVFDSKTFLRKALLLGCRDSMQ